MKYVIISKVDREVWGVFESLEHIDEALVGKSYLGRDCRRVEFCIYREQGLGLGVPVASIEQCPVNKWVGFFKEA